MDLNRLWGSPSPHTESALFHVLQQLHRSVLLSMRTQVLRRPRPLSCAATTTQVSVALACAPKVYADPALFHVLQQLHRSVLLSMCT